MTLTVQGGEKKRKPRRASEIFSCLKLDINPYHNNQAALADAESKFFTAKVRPENLWLWPEQSLECRVISPPKEMENNSIFISSKIKMLTMKRLISSPARMNQLKPQSEWSLPASRPTLRKMRSKPRANLTPPPPLRLPRFLLKTNSCRSWPRLFEQIFKLWRN